MRVFSLALFFFLLSTNSVESNDIRQIKDELLSAQSAIDEIDSRIEKMGLKRTSQVFHSKASWYGGLFHGRVTANNEAFDKNLFTAAHRSLPLNSYLLITNLNNNKQLVVKINDRGPFIAGRDLDLSEAAADFLDAKSAGVIPVSYEVLSGV
jgi:rare lipoprotein A